MILAAGLLVLVGLGLFVAGIATGATVLYWLCVVACGAAGVFLFLAWRTIKAGAAPGAEPRTATAPDARAAEKAPIVEKASSVEKAPTAGEAPITGQSVGESATPAAGTPDREPSTTEPAQTVAAAGATAASVADAPAGATGSAGSAEAPAEPASAPATTGAPTSGAPTSGAAHTHRGGSVDGAAHAHRGGSVDGEPLPGEPPLEEVEVTDLLLVVDLRDEVLVVDEHPRYHLAGCRWLTGRETIPLPIDEARTDGFTPCGICEPDRHLADLERSRKAARRTS